MDFIFSYSDIQHIVLVKLCFFLFVSLGLIGIYKKWKPIFFVILMSVTSALAYYFLVRGTALMFWGLRADEITIAAMYEMFAHGPFWGDFAYAALPPFYPPLFFWLFGLVGRLLDLNGIQIAKIASFSTILVFPIFFYLTQKFYWLKRKAQDSDKITSLVWMLGTFFLFIFVSWDAIIIKPYELISASLVILWTVFLLSELKRGFNWRSGLIFGVTGAVLFLLFYFWFFLAAIGVALFNLFEKRVSLKNYVSLISVAILTILLASPFWLPLAKSYSLYGAENWQLGFLVVSWLSTHAPLLDFSLVGLLSFFGFCTLIFYRGRFYIRALLSLFVASYVWQLMGLVTILFFASPLQESKGFRFWDQAILALAAAYGIGRLFDYFTQKYPTNKWQASLAIVGVLLLSTQLLFGTFVDDSRVLAIRDRSSVPGREAGEIVEFLDNNYEDIYQMTILQSGIPELHAFLPINDFIYFNQHNSHPAANFSQRFYYLKSLELVQTKEEFYDKIVNTPFGGIDLLILFKNQDKYSLFFNLDNFPNEMREELIDIPQDLIDDNFFEEKFDNKDYKIFAPKL